MEQRRPPEYILEISVDRASAKDVVKGILHTIFFHRYFTPLYPATHDVLDVTLPYVSEDDIATLVDARATALVRQLDASVSTSSTASPPLITAPTPTTVGSPALAPFSSSTRASRGQIIVQFLEKKRRKGWFVAKADEETVWECWVLNITLLSAPITTAASGAQGAGVGAGAGGAGDAGSGLAHYTEENEGDRWSRRAVERSVQRAALQIVAAVNRERAHIPPITTNEANPFPYQVLVNPKTDGWGQKMGMF